MDVIWSDDRTKTIVNKNSNVCFIQEINEKINNRKIRIIGQCSSNFFWTFFKEKRTLKMKFQLFDFFFKINSDCFSQTGNAWIASLTLFWFKYLGILELPIGQEQTYWDCQSMNWNFPIRETNERFDLVAILNFHKSDHTDEYHKRSHIALDLTTFVMDLSTTYHRNSLKFSTFFRISETHTHSRAFFI
jgi:hypothetical protein